jgi:hypothetical protein
LTVSATQLLGGAAADAPGGHVTLSADVGHGVLVLSPDGSFTYQPDPGYVGVDSFRYALTYAGETSAPVEATLEIDPVGGPTMRPQGAMMIGSVGRGGPTSADVTFGSLGPLSFSFEWLIPGLVVSVPGLLVLLVIAAQMLTAGAWLPLVRRDLGDFGLGAWRRRRRGARP